MTNHRRVRVAGRKRDSRNPVLIFGLLSMVLVLFPARAEAQGTPADYARAELFLSPAVDTLFTDPIVHPHWIGETDRLWYERHTDTGAQVVLVDPEARTAEPAFDHHRLAAALHEARGRTVPKEGGLPAQQILFDPDAHSVHFAAFGDQWHCDVRAYRCQRANVPLEQDPRASLSPDGRRAAVIRNHDLYVRSLDTGVETRLTFDGTVERPWSTLVLPPSYALREAGLPEGDMPVSVWWAPDSRHLVTHRLDLTSQGSMHIVQSRPPEGLRPVHYRYGYTLPGDTGTATAQLYVFDIESESKLEVEIDPFPVLHYGDLNGGHPIRAGEAWWNSAADRFFFLRWERGDRSATLVEVDASSGQSRSLFQEGGSAWTQLGPGSATGQIADIGNEILWWSRRDGWPHLYVLDPQEGVLVRRLTEGSWAVRRIEGIDEAGRKVFFTAGGREEGRDPYYRHLYSVGFDGTGLRLLTPEDADHQVSISPSGNYFVDRFGRMDSEPVTVVRRSDDGSHVLRLEEADLGPLLQMGWQRPIPFALPGRDGETSIYGLMVLPTAFDSTRSYPVLDYIYQGPQRIQTPKMLNLEEYWSNGRRVWTMQQFAELGFVVLTIDGMGTPYRSRAFHEKAYQNLGDAGLPDHVAVIETLAERYSFLDRGRVGIFGHSAGGYASTRAMLTRPDFYKVAVSSAGSHDHRLDKSAWVERWMGPMGPHYEEQANASNAHRLKGKLLLAHGELDDNVHPGVTMQLVSALMEAEKDFEFVLVPGVRHGITRVPEFIRKRWDFLVRHLIGVEPPTVVGPSPPLPTPGEGIPFLSLPSFFCFRGSTAGWGGW